MRHRRRRHGTKANVQPKTIEEIKANFINDMKSIEGMADGSAAEDFWDNNIQSKNKEKILQSIGQVQLSGVQLSGTVVPGADAGLVSAIETFINKAETPQDKGKIMAALMKISRNMPILEEGLKKQTSEEIKEAARAKRSIFRRRLKSKKAGKRRRTRKKRKRRRTKKKRKRRRRKRRRTRK
tara:strand:- start:477 stop:1022 length:546 start_codon:yes stop_codon:yes gene_type:complete